MVGFIPRLGGLAAFPGELDGHRRHAPELAVPFPTAHVDYFLDVRITKKGPSRTWLASFGAPSHPDQKTKPSVPRKAPAPFREGERRGLRSSTLLRRHNR